MKATRPLIILAAALFCNSLAVAGPKVMPGFVPLGPADVKVTGVSQNLNYQLIKDKTNFTIMGTNFSYELKSTTTNFAVNADWLLSLLGNSYQTNFPTGSKLLLNENLPFIGFVVTDSTGTNFFFPGNVLSVSAPSAFVHSGVQTDSTTNSSGHGPYTTGNDTESGSWVCTITYDDSAMTNTFDHTHTTFSCTGLGRGKFSENLVNAFLTQDFTITLIGSGSVRGQPAAIFTGSIRCKDSGFNE